MALIIAQKRHTGDLVLTAEDAKVSVERRACHKLLATEGLALQLARNPTSF